MSTALLPWLFTLAVSALPFYKGLFNVAAALFMVCWILSANFASRWRRLVACKAGIYWACLLLWVALGTTYTPTPWDEMGKVVGFILKSAFILMAFSAIEYPHIRHYITAFMVVNIWAAALVFVSHFGLIPSGLSAQVGDWLSRARTDHISQGIRFALAAACLAYLSESIMKTSRWLSQALSAVACLFALVVGYISTGRTGYLALLAVLIVIAVWKRPVMIQILGVLSIFLASILVFHTSDSVNQRVKLAVNDWQIKEENPLTSIGERIDMWRFAIEKTKERPVFGFGSGSYPRVAAEYFLDDSACRTSCPHPHNQFLYFAVENGLVGVALYVAFIGSTVVAAWRTTGRVISGSAACVMAVLVADSLTHGPFWITNEFHLFAVAIPVALAAMATSSQAQAPT